MELSSEIPTVKIIRANNLTKVYSYESKAEPAKTDITELDFLILIPKNLFI